MNRLRQSLINSLFPALLVLVCITVVHFFAEPFQVRVAYVFFMNLTIAIGLQIFMGNTGIVSFGHISFMGIGSYAVAILTIPLAMKRILIPDAPFGLAYVHLSIFPACVVAIAFTVLIATLFGFVLKRLTGNAAEILTLALLVITHVVFIAWIDLFRGPRALYGIPIVSTLYWAGAAAIVAIVIAKAFRDSEGGLQLRASSENLLAARAMGVPVEKLRFRAWILSSGVVAMGGILHATFLGTVGPNSYYFDQTFLIMAMVILGGMRSVSGAIIGTALVAAGSELARTLENGPVIFGEKLPTMFGLTGFFLGAVIVLSMILRRDGIMGDDEFEDVFHRWMRRRKEENSGKPSAVSTSSAS
ncbi:MAG: branched-chain amino acid ABC transporter permease [Parvibaculaceae bacterium]|nr:branched-chain amino acid ABC transporter permease [Parvibaculaceae bacterium]